ncbi:membrane integrity-associated transporter subunit PqiC [Allochromatium humboldtianum]|uniref:Membrane integrity-associated transporter subunit PqiC n=1 Tax=Allochromatium humboldtianum TaxID=504901 RepID=A0A850R4M5_9GAMM|nr:PqiC family protein [Allochromatium humboldtianum]NVZ08318.1 membrane integrity-associated transporter subunit PqiC [Allochromatium humboldtianum]
MTLSLARWIPLSLALSIGLPGCASTPPSNFYTLAPIPAFEAKPSSVGREGRDDRLEEELAIGLGPVTFPLFLDRPQIVSRASANRLAIDELERWGGTLQDDFLRVWSENLALLTGSSRILILPSEIRYPLDVRLSAEILAFEGTAEGQAELRVRWSVLEPNLDQVLLARESRYQRAIAQPGDTQALLAALSLTLADFSREVAEALRHILVQREWIGTQSVH